MIGLVPASALLLAGALQLRPHARALLAGVTLAVCAVVIGGAAVTTPLVEPARLAALWGPWPLQPAPWTLPLLLGAALATLGPDQEADARAALSTAAALLALLLTGHPESSAALAGATLAARGAATAPRAALLLLLPFAPLPVKLPALALLLLRELSADDAASPARATALVAAALPLLQDAASPATALVAAALPSVQGGVAPALLALALALAARSARNPGGLEALALVLLGLALGEAGRPTLALALFATPLIWGRSDRVCAQSGRLPGTATFAGAVAALFSVTPTHWTFWAALCVALALLRPPSVATNVDRRSLLRLAALFAAGLWPLGLLQFAGGLP